MTEQDLRALLKEHHWTLKRKFVKSRNMIHFYAVRRISGKWTDVYLCTPGTLAKQTESSIVAKLLLNRPDDVRST